METINAIIKEASIHDIYDIFTRKPNGLKFNDTDALVVKAKTSDGTEVTKAFYLSLKSDGTFSKDTLNRGTSRIRRQRLESFIKHYELATDVKNYNLKTGISEWTGKKIEIVSDENYGSIYIP